MISAIMYFITGVVLAIFSYESYLAGYGKGIKNPFANYFFWSTMIIAVSAFKSAIMIPIILSTNNLAWLFWVDFVGRAMFYAGALFTVQIPLYKMFPKNKKVFILSYIYGLIGVGLLVYQFINRNVPTINDSGIINWGADTIMAIGIAILMFIPWAVISIIFIIEFIKSKYGLPKPFLLGAGFFMICAFGLAQDLSQTIGTYLLSSILSITGFLLALAGMFYEKDNSS